MPRSARDDALHLYNGRDVFTQMVSEHGLAQDLTRDGTWGQHAIDTKMLTIAREMSHLGLIVDTSKREEYSRELRRRCAKLIEKMRDLTGRPKFNPRSPKQVRDWLYDERGHTPILNTSQDAWEEDDDPSTSMAALTALSDILREGSHGQPPGKDERFCETLIRYRAYEKLRSSNVDNLPEVTHEDPRLPKHLRRLFSSFSVYRTPSGRLSSSKPVNFQNWRKLGEFNMRQMIVAAPGHVLVVIDFSRLEAVLWAIAAQDELYLRAIREGLDIHTVNMATMHREENEDPMTAYRRLIALKTDPDEKVRKDFDFLRLLAKGFGFGKQYGAGWATLYKNMSKQRDPVTFERVFPDLKPSDVRSWDQRYEEDHPAKQLHNDRVEHRVKRYGFARERIHGRRRHFPGGPNKPDAPNNHETQGEAAATANDAAMRIVEEIPFYSLSPWTGLCNQVHDELGVQVPERYGEETYQTMMGIMEREIDGIPINAEGGVFKVWTGEDLRE